MADVIPPNYAKKVLQRGIDGKERWIRETLSEIETLQQSYVDACAHLDRLHEEKDQLTQALRLLG